MPTLTGWLSRIGLERYAARFELERIDLDVLPDLTEADLERLGVALGDRKRLLKAIRDRHPAAGATGRSTAAPMVELRQVTVLFVDLSGYTQLTTSLGAERTHALVQRFYGMVSAIVRSHSGAVERHIGDAVMAVFGLPVAHGNDPERALRAAQAMHEAMPGLGAEIGRPVLVHAGIASGQVVASRAAGTDDFATVGDAVNLAARLVNLAQPGDTVISDAVHRAAGAIVSAESVGEVSVKGFEQPVRAWRVAAWRAERSERAPLVGREAQLEQFDALCEACAARRQGAWVVVRGEAGIGKTRLIEAFADAARQRGFAVHAALVLDFGAGRALDPVRRLAASVAGAPADVDDAGRAAWLVHARRHGLVLEDETMVAADLLGLPLPESLRPLYDAMDNATRQRRRAALVVELVRRASLERPQLLLVEDVHWAAPEALDTLAALTHGIAGHPVAIAVTSRVQGDPASGTWGERLNHQLRTLVIDLQPLPAAAAQTLARALGGTDDAALQALVDRAGGNPLYLEQLLRNAAAGARETLPGSIQSIVLARLDRLGLRDRRALQAASVLGQVFSLPLLRHLLEDDGYECARLVEEHLVREIDEGYLFAHALVWEGTYLSLLSEQKRDWHVRAADWFAQRDPLLTAEHLDRAQDPRAPGAYLEAGRAESAAHRPERALQALERGIAIAGDDAERASLLAESAHLLPTLGRTQEALDAARRLLESATDARERARARIGIANALRLLDRHQEALDVLQAAQDEVPAALDHADHSRIHNLRGALFFPLARVREGLEEQTRALEQARLAGSIELQLRALSGLGDAHYAGGRLVSAHDSFKECVELSRAHRIVQVEAANLPMLAIGAYFVARIDAALEHARAGLALARRLSNPRAEVISHHSICMVAVETGDPDLLAPHARASLEIAQAIGARRFVPEGMLFTAQSMAWAGQRQEARQLMLQALALAHDHMSYMGPWILGALSAHAPDDSECEGWLAQGERVLRDGAAAHNYLGFYQGAIEASLHRQRWDETLRYCQALDAAFAAEPVPLARFVSARGRILARRGRGERDPQSSAELSALISQGRRAGLLARLQALERAAENG